MNGHVVLKRADYLSLFWISSPEIMFQSVIDGFLVER